MIIKVKVSAGAKQNKVERIDDTTFKVFTSKKPQKGQANDSAIKLLSAFFHVSKSSFRVKRGLKTTDKIIEIHD